MSKTTFELAKSFRLFILGIFKKGYFLLFAILDLTQIFDFLGLPMLVPYPYNWIIFWFLLGLAIFGAYHDLRMSYVKLDTELRNKPINSYNLIPRNKRSDIVTNISVITNLCRQMDTLHGANDDYGIKREIKDGEHVDDIMKHNCTICGEPRNKWKGVGH